MIDREHREDTIKENVRKAKNRAILLDVAVNTKLCTVNSGNPFPPEIKARFCSFWPVAR